MKHIKQKTVLSFEPYIPPSSLKLNLIWSNPKKHKFCCDMEKMTFIVHSYSILFTGMGSHRGTINYYNAMFYDQEFCYCYFSCVITENMAIFVCEALQEQN